MWPRPRPTCTPSFILIHPTAWPQYTNLTDRQTDRQDRQRRSDSIGRTVSQTVVQKSTFTKFSAHVSRAVARSSSDDNRIRYVLPVLWMTSRFPILGHVACGVGNICSSHKFPTYSPGGATLFDSVVEYNDSKQQIAHRGREGGRSLMVTFALFCLRLQKNISVQRPIYLSSSTM